MGDADCQYEMGLCHEKGYGVKSGIETAKAFFTQSAAQGNSTWQTPGRSNESLPSSKVGYKKTGAKTAEACYSPNRESANASAYDFKLFFETPTSGTATMEAAVFGYWNNSSGEYKISALSSGKAVFSVLSREKSEHVNFRLGGKPMRRPFHGYAILTNDGKRHQDWLKGRRE